MIFTVVGQLDYGYGETDGLITMYVNETDAWYAERAARAHLKLAYEENLYHDSDKKYAWNNYGTLIYAVIPGRHENFGPDMWGGIRQDPTRRQSHVDVAGDVLAAYANRLDRYGGEE